MSMTKTVYGGDVDAMALYHAISHGDVYLGARSMPLSSASVSGGGRSASLNLSGAIQFTAGVSWPF